MDTRRRPAVLAGSVLLLVTLAEGCAAKGDGAAGPTAASDGAAPTLALSAAPVSTTVAGGAATPLPDSFPSQLTTILRGTLVEGVETTCLILKTDDAHEYQLIGLDPHLSKVGYRLEVFGYKAVGVQSLCMQGILFKVIFARKI